LFITLNLKNFICLFRQLADARPMKKNGYTFSLWLEIKFRRFSLGVGKRKSAFGA